MAKKRTKAQRAARIAKRHRNRELTISSIKRDSSVHSMKEFLWLTHYGQLKQR